MQKLTRADLHSLEIYHEKRSELRQQVLAHKANRKVYLGAHAALYFEDRITIQYQIQEMLRVERIFASAAIEDELDAYNPLIPDGDNLKATFMLEYTDADQRRVALTRLRGIENTVWLQIGTEPRVVAVADEDLGRSDDDKTAAVHFLRFQFTPAMIAACAAGAALGLGIEHPAYQVAVAAVAPAVRAALCADLI